MWSPKLLNTAATRRVGESTEMTRCRKYARFSRAHIAVAASRPATTARHVIDNPSSHHIHIQVRCPRWLAAPGGGGSPLIRRPAPKHGGFHAGLIIEHMYYSVK